MKKIALLGMGNHSNLGDQIIVKTTEYILSSLSDITIVKMNFLNDLSSKRYQKYKTIRSKAKNDKQIYQLMRLYAWKDLERNVKNVDGIIIACGSFKYTTQYLWASYATIMEFAYCYNIPVMFSAMNVEKYSDDWRCKLLSEWLNKSDVRKFSVRDGAISKERLVKDYFEHETSIDLVGDPALWALDCYAEELYDVKKNNKLGINLIRPNIFMDYEGSISHEKLTIIYYELTSKLDERGIEWQFFTNGMKVDELMLESILGKKHDKNKVFIPESDKALVKYIFGCNSIMSARLHASIIAYSLGVPVSGFMWGNKFGYINNNGLEDFFCDEKRLTSQVLYENIINSSRKKVDKNNIVYWKKATKDSLEDFVNQC